MNRHAHEASLGLLLVLSVLISACATPPRPRIMDGHMAVHVKPWDYVGTPSDPFWWSEKINLGQLHHQARRDGNGRTVAVLDSGFSTSRSDVVDPSRIHASAVESCSKSPTKDYDDINGHGTAMAVIAVGNEGPDTPKKRATGGIAPKATLLPIRVVCGVATADSVAQGLDIAVRAKADVILLALGGWPSDDLTVTTEAGKKIDDRVSKVVENNRGVLFVVASVWDGAPGSLFPLWTAEENVIVVAATKLKPGITVNPIAGEDYYSVKSGDIWAPGLNIETAFIDYTALIGYRVAKYPGTYGSYLMQGTSAAAAIVAGCAAAVKGANDVNAVTLKKRLIGSAARDALDRKEPRLDCFKAIGP
jgi:Subtilase family